MLITNSNLDEVFDHCKNYKLAENENLLILVGEKSRVNIYDLITKLNESNIRFLGGIFPAVIYEEEKSEDAIVINSIPLSYKPMVVNNIDRDEYELPQFENLTLNADENMTCLIMVDGLCENTSLFLSKLFNIFGNSVNYIGGGAGYLSKNKTDAPCLFSPEGFNKNCAIVSFIPLKSSLGVQHGLQKVCGPIVATKTKKNVIKELNWQNAFQVYKELVEKDSSQKFDDYNFFDISQRYPLGMHKNQLEDVARDPIITNEDGELICIGDVPENTILNLLRADDDKIINAASEAAKQISLEPGTKAKYSLIFDCICRSIFLKEKYKDEILAVVNELPKSNSLFGAFTLGEISSYGNGYLEFFNETTVIGVLYE